MSSKEKLPSPKSMAAASTTTSSLISETDNSTSILGFPKVSFFFFFLNLLNCLNWLIKRKNEWIIKWKDCGPRAGVLI